MNLSSRILFAAALLTLTAGCGSSVGDNAADSNESDSAGSDSSTSVAPQPTPSAGPTYRILNKERLNETLLGIQDLPAGYSQDPPEPEGANKTFCDYKPPFNEKVRVRRDFSKGGGMSAEILSVGLRQYANPQQAKAAFDALIKTLKTCNEETYEGSKLTYAPMSAPKVGDATVGVKITSDGMTLLQNFALVGPTLVNTGGGGLMNASADDVNTMLATQVKAYQTTATH